jgi:nucleotide-binding universal stress UspA family protein
MKIQRIVVGLELGHLSDPAVVRAMSLARELGATLDVVHGAGVETARFKALPQALSQRLMGDAEARAREAARGKLQLLVEDPAFAARPVDEYLHVRREAPAGALLAFAREHSADVIVLGAHRHRARLDFGGTGRAVLARSTCPVWIEPAEYRRFERVLAPIDLSSYTDLVLRTARAVARRFEVPVRVLHVFQPPALFQEVPPGAATELGKALEDLFRREKARTHELVRGIDWGPMPVETDFADGDPATAIVEHAGPADLVVMGTHGQRDVFRAVLGSCAYRVLKRARGPILVVPQLGTPLEEA